MRVHSLNRLDADHIRLFRIDARARSMVLAPRFGLLIVSTGPLEDVDPLPRPYRPDRPVAGNLVAYSYAP